MLRTMAVLSRDRPAGAIFSSLTDASLALLSCTPTPFRFRLRLSGTCGAADGGSAVGRAVAAADAAALGKPAVSQ